MAKADVPRGGTLTKDLLVVGQFPRNIVPKGAFAKIEEALDRVVYIPLVKDDVVVSAKLVPKGSGRGLAALIPKGMRAYTVQTPNLAAGVAGFVLPGNKVDVLLTVSDISGEDKTGGTSTTLLQNVEILAVDQKMEAPAENKVDAKELRSVTLLVMPQQANLLDLGQNQGKLHLSLRNLDDRQDAHTKPTTLVDLRFRHEKPWDERAMGLLAALGKALAQRKPAPAAPAAAPHRPPEPPPAILIRTVRGAREGGVLIQTPENGGALISDRGNGNPEG
jgi:pilus assembly protein CpaB